jgi:hypothetical protein
MSEFFGRLETELRAAAERPPRRAVPVPAIAVACVLALAVAPLVIALGGGEGGGRDGGGADLSVQRGTASEAPPAAGPQEGDRAYVLGGAEGGQTIATGVAPVSGDWRLVLYKQDETRCVALFEAGREPSGDEPVLCLYDDMPPPEFSALTMPWPDGGAAAEELLSAGAAPEEAVAVELVSDGAVVERVEPIETPEGDYFVMPMDADASADGVLRWVGSGGQAGDKEIPVNMP